jgi:histidyl-tRNA synthetase
MRYREKLVSYYTPFRAELSADSQVRLEKNPLRILDSKDENDKKLNQTAPKFDSCLNETSKKFFDDVLCGLQALNIAYQVDSQLVRGLDYYTHTVFEFVTTDLGAQGTVLAGGRYDGLIASMGGPQTAAVGWAAGIERLMSLCEMHLLPQASSLCVIAPADEAGEKYSLTVAAKCRSLNIRTEILWSGNVGKKLKKANALNADLAIILGSTEVQSGQLTIKNLKTGAQVSLSLNDLNQITKLLNPT